MGLGQKGLKGLFQGGERGSWGDSHSGGEWLMAGSTWESAGPAGRMLFLSVPDGNQIPPSALSPATFSLESGSRCTVYLWVTGMQKVSASSQAK